MKNKETTITGFLSSKGIDSYVLAEYMEEINNQNKEIEDLYSNTDFKNINKRTSFEHLLFVIKQELDNSN